MNDLQQEWESATPINDLESEWESATPITEESTIMSRAKERFSKVPTG